MAEIAFVIPVAPGRESNLELVLAQLVRGDPEVLVMVVIDGPGFDAERFDGHGQLSEGIRWLFLPEKHEPGMVQPRNLGVASVECSWPDVTHAWFLDSDVVLDPDAMSSAMSVLEQPWGQDAILVSPYDWLPEGLRPAGVGDEGWLIMAREISNDPRWPMFRNWNPEREFKGDLSAGLACFSGNLIWPIGEFKRVGGFWNELHHGRCEDGELGLRAVAMDVPIRVVPGARGYHLWHPRDGALIYERNARDVPMLDARHPWLQGAGVFLVDREGASFDTSCPTCKRRIPTGDAWNHVDQCQG